MTERGRFITVEGIDGAGKTTHLPVLKASVERAGHIAWMTREPGGTALGEALRALVLTEPMAPITEALLMFAARGEHYRREIAPRLARGEWIVCDRFSDATYAYQGGGHGVAMHDIAALERMTLDAARPDLTIVFDVPVAVGRARLADGRVLDRFERERSDFFERVRSAYLERARAEPSRFRVIDATRAPPIVASELESLVAAL